MQRARLALVQQALEEEQQRHVAGGFIVHRFHGAGAGVALYGFAMDGMDGGSGAIGGEDELRGDRLTPAR